MAEVNIPLGLNAVLYFGAPSMTGANMVSGALQFESARDVSIVIEKEDAEAHRRATGSWEDTRESVKRLRVTWDMVCVTSSGGERDDLDILRKTFISGTYNAAGSATGISLYPVSGTTAGSSGIYGDFIVTRFERVETHGDILMYNCEAKMTQVHGRTPTWYDIPV